MIEHALQYASRGWRVFPLHTVRDGRCSCNKNCGRDLGKHPRTRHGVKDATVDIATIERWWRRWPDANIGIATGNGLVVVDIDGPENLTLLQKLVMEHAPLPKTTAVTATGRGWHVYFKGDFAGSRTVQGLLIRGEGGYVVAPPSVHATGKKYQWLQQLPLVDLPEWLRNWVQTAGNTKETVIVPTTLFGPLPAYLQQHKQQRVQQLGGAIAPVTERALQAERALWSLQEEERIEAALDVIPASCERETWLRVGMALHDLHWVSGPDGGDRGLEIWDWWSQSSPEKYGGRHDTETRWRSFGKPGRGGVTLGTLFHIAGEYGWVPPVETAVINHKQEEWQNPLFTATTEAQAGGAQRLNGYGVASDILPANFTVPNEAQLIKLNDQYACIGDIGGKCLVMGWVPSKVDDALTVPSFQNFRNFTERYANRYITIKKAKGEDGTVEDKVQLGATWLKWRGRRTFDGLDLAPGAAAILPGNVLNMWDGFGVTASAGAWDRMKEHIAAVLAQGVTECFTYIVKWAAWAVQHPADRAEVALVFKGAKGSGKGSFANALRRIFGQHGLQIFSSKHLVGQFNGHLRNCLLLFADEAFWAGDKQGESVLKGMLTEPALMLEQKGVDAAPWRNRLHVIMAANADWVVPASHDERRYAMFNVSDKYLRNDKYFDALHREMREGGLSAMLHDLQQVQLGTWHPRQILQTEALQQQKLRSLDARLEWFEGMLQEGLLPYAGSKEGGRAIPMQFLIHTARESTPRLRDISVTALGLFLKSMGCVKMHSCKGNAWQFEPLMQARERWTARFGTWGWERQSPEWENRS